MSIAAQPANPGPPTVTGFDRPWRCENLLRRRCAGVVEISAAIRRTSTEQGALAAIAPEPALSANGIGFADPISGMKKGGRN